MAYKPFLIAPFATGLDTEMEPWQLPQDAFSELSNAYIHHGVIEKREGFTYQGSIVHKNGTNWDITGVTQANPGVVSVTSTTGLSNGDTVEIRDVTGMTELNGNKYTISSVAAGSFALTNVDTTNFGAWAGAGGVYLVPQLRAMGLWNYIDSDNVKELVAFDTKRMSVYDPSSKQYDPIDTADIMSGGNNDYIWAANWASTSSSTASTLYRLYFTNGVALSGGLNGIRYYDGGSSSLPFNPQINSLTTINGCKLLFAFGQRLLLLHTIEGANTYPQRARWCQAQKPGTSGAFTDEWDDNVPGKGGFVDAPTGDHIISAQFIQDQLIVFMTNSVWSLRRNSDPSLPFRWEKINDFRSCGGKMATSQFDRFVLAAGVRGITATDGVQTQRFDEKIQDFVSDEVNDADFEKVFAKRSFENRKMWMLYPSGQSSTADAALIYDEDSGSFSTNSIDMNVLGYGGAADDAGIDDFGDKTLSEFDEAVLKSFYLDEGSEILVGGDQNGDIYVMESGSNDQQTIFEATIVDVTQANPGVVTMTGNVGLSNGDIITISDIAAGSMVELNDREFVVASKSGNTFQLQGEDTSGYAAYVAGSDGTIGFISSNSVECELLSAAWNPWMAEGKQSQLGYIDLFLDTELNTELNISFYTNNSLNPYSQKTINLLPNLVERGAISNITNASPGQVTAAEHGLETNDKIYIYGADGMDAVNGIQFTVTVVDENNFTIGTDTTNYGLYTNGGVVTELPYVSTKAWKRVYAGGTGYQHRIKITSEGKDRPMRIHAFMPWFRPRSRRPI